MERENDAKQNELDPLAAAEFAAGLLDDEEFVKKYVLKNPTVQRLVIEAYLRGMKNSAPVSPKGGAPLSPQKRPKTLEEAKQLCELYLNRL